MADWLITVSFPTLSDGNLSHAYVFCAFFAALLSVPFILEWVPESKGRALEEIGRIPAGPFPRTHAAPARTWSRGGAVSVRGARVAPGPYAVHGPPSGSVILGRRGSSR